MNTPLPQQEPAGEDIPVVVLVSASWAGPSRPAPTVLRELGRRWGTAVQTLLIEDPEEEVLDALRVEVIPTWMRFVRPASALTAEPEGGQERLVVDLLEGRGADGASVRLEGPWELTERRQGALPKHAVDAVFGPEADA